MCKSTEPQSIFFVAASNFVTHTSLSGSATTTMSDSRPTSHSLPLQKLGLMSRKSFELLKQCFLSRTILQASVRGTTL